MTSDVMFSDKFLMSNVMATNLMLTGLLLFFHITSHFCYTKSGSAKQPYNENHGQCKRYQWHIANVSITPAISLQCTDDDFSRFCLRLIYSYSETCVSLALQLLLKLQIECLVKRPNFGSTPTFEIH